MTETLGEPEAASGDVLSDPLVLGIDAAGMGSLPGSMGIAATAKYGEDPEQQPPPQPQRPEPEPEPEPEPTPVPVTELEALPDLEPELLPPSDLEQHSGYSASRSAKPTTLSAEVYAVDERGKQHRMLDDAASSEFCELLLSARGLELSAEIVGAWAGVERRQRKLRSPDSKSASTYLEGAARGSVRHPQLYEDPAYRKAAHAIVASHVLEVLVITSIVANTVILMLQHPQNTFSPSINQTMRTIDLVLTCIFTAEMCIRIAAHGFNTAASPLVPAYLHDGWNRMDMLVVIFSWVSVIYDLAQPAGTTGELSGLLQSLSALRYAGPSYSCPFAWSDLWTSVALFAGCCAFYASSNRSLFSLILGLS